MAASRVAVRSRFTNINGGYEVQPDVQSFGRPAFRRTDGGAWLFSAASSGAGSSTRWHFGPERPRAAGGGGGSPAFFCSEGDAPTPEAAPWSEEYVERVWRPDEGNDPRLTETIFVDRGFPHSDRSIGEIPELVGRVEWLPVRSLRAGQWRLFDGSVSPNDLLQGAIGDCWLVAAMASLAEFPEAVEALFSERDLSPTGRCEIRLYDARKMGQVRVTIDDFIPCHPRQWWDDEGAPIFARPNGNEAWVLLLEKAFAKMLGSYRELSGGNCCTAFRAFTGETGVFVWARSDGESARAEGSWKRLGLAEGATYFEFDPATAERRHDEGLWAEVCAYSWKSFLVACSMRARNSAAGAGGGGSFGPGREHMRRDGLVEAHAYSLLQALEVDGERLLFLRNPWGNDKKWNGRWSDGDVAWARRPGLRKRLRPNFREDGAFWMAWADFREIFDFVFVCPKTMRSPEAAADHERRTLEGTFSLPSPPPPSQPSVPSAPSATRQGRRRRLARALPERLPLLPVGARTEIIGAGEELDGRILEILGWDGEASEYLLQELPSPYWACSACGELNRRSRQACNVCFGPQEVVGALNRFRVRPECVLLPVGTEVEVQGLVAFPELNGQLGRIVAFDRRSGRYHVELPDGRARAVRPPHVVWRGGPAEEPEEFVRWTPPAEDPSPVDEPEAPDEAPCSSDQELRQLADELDEDFTLKRDVQLPGGAKLRRGQQLLREGELLGGIRKVAELRREGIVRTRIRIRFTRRSPLAARFGPGLAAYAEAALRLDAVIAAILAEELRRRPPPGPNCFHFVGLARRGWAPPAPDSGGGGRGGARPSGRPKAWAGWVCPQCGHVNDAGTDYCSTCEPDG